MLPERITTVAPQCTVTYHISTTPDGKVCKPSRKTFERQCKQLADEIHIIQGKLADNKAFLNELFAKLDKLRDERNAKFAEKSEVEGSVKEMSVNINKLSDRLAQLQSKLHYRDMKKLEDAIRTLQNHLDSRHFRHSEERKIVAEIDKLNRSKKVVGEYLETQRELKELRATQHSRRVDRDKLIKEIVVIRKQEEETRDRITSSKTQEGQLRADVDSLTGQKKALHEEFTKHEQMYTEQKAALKQAEEKQKHQQQQCRLSHNVPTRCLGDSIDDFESKACSLEVVNCQKLIEFCERLTKQLSDEKAGQRQRKKKISYSTDVLSQFLSLDFCPPMTVGQACLCIPLLQQKLHDLQRMDGASTPRNELVTERSIDIVAHTTATTTLAVDELPEFDVPEEGLETVAEHPDDQSDKSSLTKQLSHTSDEDATEYITYKLQLLNNLYHDSEQKSTDSIS